MFPSHSSAVPTQSSIDTFIVNAEENSAPLASELTKNWIFPQTNCTQKSRLCVKNWGYLLVLLMPWFIILAMRKISNLSTFLRQQCVKLRVHFPCVKSQHGMNEEECGPRALIETQPRFESQGTRCLIRISSIAARRRHWVRWSLYGEIYS